MGWLVEKGVGVGVGMERKLTGLRGCSSSSFYAFRHGGACLCYSVSVLIRLHSTEVEGEGLIYK